MSCTHMILEAESQHERKGYSIFTYGEAVGYRLDIFSFFFFLLLLLLLLFLLCHFTILPWDQYVF